MEINKEMNKYNISEIWIYPVKSLGGIKLKSAIVESKGLKYDRRWVIVDENNRFLSQRELPQMALISVGLSIENGQLNIMEFTHLANEPNKYILKNPERSFENSMKITVQVWDDSIEGILINDGINDWLSVILGLKCRLVYMPDTTKRHVDSNYANSVDDETSFSDAYPYLIVGTEAMKLLNSKLEEPISIVRFRPNIVFDGGQPHDEDNWKKIIIGDSEFLGVKNCARCQMLTIDPSTAERGKEPLKTLNKYRARNNKVYFGQNLLVTKKGLISIGDEVVVVF
jgi:uncharacterized protein